jgi:hypothetical protein
VPFVPIGLLGDCVAWFPGRATLAEQLSDAEIADFARGLTRALRGFARQRAVLMTALRVLVRTYNDKGRAKMQP